MYSPINGTNNAVVRSYPNSLSGATGTNQEPAESNPSVSNIASPSTEDQPVSPPLNPVESYSLYQFFAKYVDENTADWAPGLLIRTAFLISIIQSIEHKFFYKPPRNLPEATYGLQKSLLIGCGTLCFLMIPGDIIMNTKTYIAARTASGQQRRVDHEAQPLLPIRPQISWLRGTVNEVTNWGRLGFSIAVAGYMLDQMRDALTWNPDGGGIDNERLNKTLILFGAWYVYFFANLLLNKRR